MCAVFPKKQSKILHDIKQEDLVGDKRARKFMKKCEQIDELRDIQRKHGTLTEKNLSKLQK